MLCSLLTKAHNSSQHSPSPTRGSSGSNDQRVSRSLQMSIPWDLRVYPSPWALLGTMVWSETSSREPGPVSAVCPPAKDTGGGEWVYRSRTNIFSRL